LSIASGSIRGLPDAIALMAIDFPQDTLIYGSIFLVSASLKRSITRSAKIQSLQDGAAAPAQGRIVWEPDNWSTLAIGYRKEAGIFSQQAIAR